MNKTSTIAKFLEFIATATSGIAQHSSGINLVNGSIAYLSLLCQGKLNTTLCFVSYILLLSSSLSVSLSVL